MNSPFERGFPFPKILHALEKQSKPGQEIFLVGGAVRDMFLEIENHDLDFVVNGDVRRLAKGVANELGAPFYMMDLEHQTARIVFQQEPDQRYFLDFAAIRGADIVEDLRARDFTINAMAVDLDDPYRIIDPLKGMQDLKDKVLRACSSTTFSDDPVRLLRAVRLSVNFKLQIDSATIQWLKIAAPEMNLTSSERLRDEFFRILEGRRVDSAIRILDQFGLLEQLVPELLPLKKLQQPAPHIQDAWEHTLAALRWLEALIDLLAKKYQEEKIGNLILGMASLVLGRFRRQFEEYFNQSLTTGRSMRGILFLATLLHDVGKPLTLSVDSKNRLHFFEHEVVGTEMVNRRAKNLVLSNLEVERTGLLVRNHMRIHQLALASSEVSRRSIYRLYRDLNDAGIGLCFLSLADTLATYGVTISSGCWERELIICRQLLDAWFEQYDHVVNPPRLITGDNLLQNFNLQPGPIIGKVLDEVHEAQAAGQVCSSKEAIALAKSLLDRYIDRLE